MHKITNDNIKFCDSFTRKLCRKFGRLADDDAIQCGRLGLVVASHHFNPEKSDNFQGYSTFWIKTHLYRDYFGFNCTKKDAMGLNKQVVEFEDSRYSNGSSDGSLSPGKIGRFTHPKSFRLTNDLIQKCCEKEMEENKICDRDLVDRCMSNLDERQKFIMKEMFYNDKSLRCIGRENENSWQCYQNNFNEAKQKLRKIFKEEVVE